MSWKYLNNKNILLLLFTINEVIVGGGVILEYVILKGVSNVLATLFA